MNERGPMPNPDSGRTERRGLEVHSESGAIGPPPKSLGDVGTAIWKIIVGTLKKRRVIGPMQRFALLEVCKLADEIDELEKDVAQNGYFYIGPNKAECERAASGILDRKRKLLDAKMTKFGMTPMDSGRLPGKQKPKEEVDELKSLREVVASRN